jgi:hypothetical protein
MTFLPLPMLDCTSERRHVCGTEESRKACVELLDASFAWHAAERVGQLTHMLSGMFTVGNFLNLSCAFILGRMEYLV